MPSVIGTYDEYHQMTVTGSDTVDGIDCYRVSLEGKSTLTISIFGMETKHIDEERVWRALPRARLLWFTRT